MSSNFTPPLGTTFPGTALPLMVGENRCQVIPESALFDWPQPVRGKMDTDTTLEESPQNEVQFGDWGDNADWFSRRRSKNYVL